MIILSFWVSSTSKNKNIDHWVKETCVIMSTKVTCETDNIPLFVKCTKFLFFIYFIVILKNKDHTRRYAKSVLLFWFATI